MNPRARRTAIRATFGLLVVGSLCGGCRQDPADLREWRATDHARVDGESPGTSAAASPEDNDPEIAVRALWMAQCAACHGSSGRGDGAQASMMRPPDFASPGFHSARTDDQLRTSILRGRGMMPAFRETLRAEAIDLLVRLVRSMGRRDRAAP